MKSKIIKLLKENTRQYLHTPKVGEGFLTYKKKFDEFDDVKIKTSAHLITTSYSEKASPRGEEDTYLQDTSTAKELCPECVEKRADNPNRAKHLHRHFLKWKSKQALNT